MIADLFTGPWRKGEHGVAVIALKRIVSRAKPSAFPWHAFSDQFNERLRVAISGLQAEHGITPATGNVGERTFKMLMGLKREGHPTERAADAPAITLLEQAWGIAHPPITPFRRIQNVITSYCMQMETYNARWHYRQARPFTTMGVKPEAGGWSDCSEYATAAFFWARKETGVFVPDPNGLAFSGYGNSQSLYQNNRSRIVTSGFYEIGDLAVYGPASATHHVTICRAGGNSSQAVFSSNGSEAGPLPTRIFYRGDFLAAVRPKLLP